MNLPAQIAKHLREVYFGGNWTSVNLKDALADVNWQQATTQVHCFNTIAILVHHTNYYIKAVAKVLQGEPLNAKDELSFDHPLIASEQGWQAKLNECWSTAEIFAAVIEGLPDEMLWEDFTDRKYGSYYRNLQGIIEHLHYHLGQIVLIKKLVLQGEEAITFNTSH